MCDQKHSVEVLYIYIYIYTKLLCGVSIVQDIGSACTELRDAFMSAGVHSNTLSSTNRMIIYNIIIIMHTIYILC